MKVCKGGVHVGWIAKSDARKIGAAMDKADILWASCKLINVSDKYPRIALQLPRRAVEAVEHDMAKESFGG